MSVDETTQQPGRVLHRPRPRVPGRYVAWLYFKWAGVVWAVAYGVFTPPATAAAFSREWAVLVLVLWLSVTFVGAVGSSAAMLVSVLGRGRAQLRGAQAEVALLGLMAVGPLIYMTTQLAIAASPPTETVLEPLVRLGAAAQGHWILAAVVVRLVEVIPRYRALLKEYTEPRSM